MIHACISVLCCFSIWLIKCLLLSTKREVMIYLVGSFAVHYLHIDFFVNFVWKILTDHETLELASSAQRSKYCKKNDVLLVSIKLNGFHAVCVREREKDLLVPNKIAVVFLVFFPLSSECIYLSFSFIWCFPALSIYSSSLTLRLWVRFDFLKMF